MCVKVFQLLHHHVQTTIMTSHQSTVAGAWHILIKNVHVHSFVCTKGVNTIIHRFTKQKQLCKCALLMWDRNASYCVLHKISVGTVCWFKTSIKDFRFKMFIVKYCYISAVDCKFVYNSLYVNEMQIEFSWAEQMCLLIC